MENQYFKMESAGKEFTLETAVYSTNELDPYKETRELGIVVFNSKKQIDFGFSKEELDSFIKFLIDCRGYINEYNENSKPIKK